MVLVMLVATSHMWLSKLKLIKMQFFQNSHVAAGHHSGQHRQRAFPSLKGHPCQQHCSGTQTMHVSLVSSLLSLHLYADSAGWMTAVGFLILIPHVPDSSTTMPSFPITFFSSAVPDTAFQQPVVNLIEL